MSRTLTAADIDQRLIDDNRTIVLVWYAGRSDDKSSKWKCLDCGDEWCTRSNGVLRGAGCPPCDIRRRAKARTITKEEIIQHLIDHNLSISLVTYGKHTQDSSSLWRCDECEHEWTTRAADVLYRNGGCPPCAIKRRSSQRLIDIDTVMQRMTNRTISLISMGKNARDNKSTIWKCDVCEHEWPASVDNVTKKGTGCPSCSGNLMLTEEVVTKKLINDNRRITLIHLGSSTSDTSSRWKCTDCDNEWPASANGVIHSKSGCPMCHGNIPYTIEQLDQLLIDNNRSVTMLYYGKNVNDPSSLWKCTDCDNEWSTSAASIIYVGSNCPKCADYGYNTGKPGHFYLHTFNGFIKIGITNCLEQRKRSLNNQLVDGVLYTINNSLSWSFENGGDALIVESMVLEAFSGRQYTGLMGTTFDGRTELLDISLHAELIDLMAKVMG